MAFFHSPESFMLTQKLLNYVYYISWKHFHKFVINCWNYEYNLGERRVVEGCSAADLQWLGSDPIYNFKTSGLINPFESCHGLYVGLRLDSVQPTNFNREKRPKRWSIPGPYKNPIRETGFRFPPHFSTHSNIIIPNSYLKLLIS